MASVAPALKQALVVFAPNIHMSKAEIDLAITLVDKLLTRVTK